MILYITTCLRLGVRRECSHPFAVPFNSDAGYRPFGIDIHQLLIPANSGDDDNCPPFDFHWFENPPYRLVHELEANQRQCHQIYERCGYLGAFVAKGFEIVRGSRPILRATRAIISELASLKLCRASAISERLPETIPPAT